MSVSATARAAVGRRAEPPRGDLLGDEVADPFLDHRAAPLVDHVGLLGADIDADDRVPAARQASRRDDTHVAKPEDGDASNDPCAEAWPRPSCPPIPRASVASPPCMPSPGIDSPLLLPVVNERTA